MITFDRQIERIKAYKSKYIKFTFAVQQRLSQYRWLDRNFLIPVKKAMYIKL